MMVIEKKPTFAFSVENKLFGREKSKECWWKQNVYNFYGNSSGITNENNDILNHHGIPSRTLNSGTNILLVVVVNSRKKLQFDKTKRAGTFFLC